ncbi:N-acetylmuramoyl-L-alanine amidase [Nonomuraea sp. NPDC050643]|uniref:N-acetylmuramoyl-L-alanine amidase n=1 Tax=Nonomuraea sp. NPDC050643 TaxID=3155660 RepID=UPI0033CF96AE
MQPLWLAAVLVAGALTAPAAVPGSSGSGRQSDFAAAARDYGVPESVLLGVAYLESRWDGNAGRPSTAGGYGPMHLVDVFPAESTHLGDMHGDPRGDDARPMSPARALDPSALRMAAAPPRTTLPEAGRLTGVDAARLRTDPAANIRAGAALLASYQERPSADPADWHGAIERYAGTDDPVASRAFADEVFAVMREGAERITDDGHPVRLDPVPGLPAETETPLDDDAPVTSDEEFEVDTDGAPITDEDSLDQETDTDEDVHLGPEPELAEPARPKGQTSERAECPSSLTCEWMPAAFKRFGKKNDRDYGNHDRLNRERAVDYLIVHDTEGSYQGIPSMIRNPKYVSWHYTIRSRDGHVAQHVATKDIAWHAGNWDVNTRSIGIEHEGYLAKGGTWYTEAMYRSSAKLARYLADKYDIPINRAHILGHDNVPGTNPKTVAGMHEDPGPYWDWAHYFELMGRPLKAAKNGDSIIIRPSYNANRPRFTGCVSTKAAQACPAHGAATVWLHTSPSTTAPLVTDLGKHPGKPSTYSVYDHSARASTGQRYAVAERQGDWTAIWYLGQKAWFHNPASNPTAIPAKGPLVTPLTADVKVYGRAYPEKSAYKGVSYQPLTPLKYRIAPGQTYTVGDTVTGSYYAANAFNAARHVTTTGKVRYHQIQLGHRVMFVMTKDVRMIG